MVSDPEGLTPSLANLCSLAANPPGSALPYPPSQFERE
jgi:hypothetical protein